MLKILKCRRSSLGLIAIIILGVGLFHGIDTSMSIASIVIGIAGSNAYQKKVK